MKNKSKRKKQTLAWGFKTKNGNLYPSSTSTKYRAETWIELENQPWSAKLGITEIVRVRLVEVKGKGKRK